MNYVYAHTYIYIYIVVFTRVIILTMMKSLDHSLPVSDWMGYKNSCVVGPRYDPVNNLKHFYRVNFIETEKMDITVYEHCYCWHRRSKKANVDYWCVSCLYDPFNYPPCIAVEEICEKDEYGKQTLIGIPVQFVSSVTLHESLPMTLNDITVFVKRAQKRIDRLNEAINSNKEELNFCHLQFGAAIKALSVEN